MSAARARPLGLALPVAGAAPADALPPFALPASHFAVALVWLGLGSICLVAVAPALARGAWLTTEAAAVAHCFTLGWLVTSAYGTLYQMGPASLGIEARSVRAGFVTLALHAAGTVLVVAGFAGWAPRLLGTGWTLVTLGLALWTWNVGSRLAHAPRAPRAGRTVLAGFACLWLGLALAGARVGNALGWWAVSRESLVAAHVQVAAVGFGTLLVMGIGGRVLPMFLLSRTAPEWPAHVAAPLVGVGVLLQAAGWLGGAHPLVLAGGGAAALGAGLFVVQAVLWYRHRARRELDPSLRQAAAAFTALGAALVIGCVALLAPQPRFVAGYGLLLLVGWLALLIAAVYSRIVPFLTWMHRYAHRAGQRGVPKVAELVPARWVRVASVAWMAGLAALVLSVLAGLPAAATVAAALFACGSATSLVLYARLAFRRASPPGEGTPP